MCVNGARQGSGTILQSRVSVLGAYVGCLMCGARGRGEVMRTWSELYATSLPASSMGRPASARARAASSDTSVDSLAEPCRRHDMLSVPA